MLLKLSYCINNIKLNLYFNPDKNVQNDAAFIQVIYNMVLNLKHGLKCHLWAELVLIFPYI